MKTSDFDFYLPEELIAQHPLLDRSSSKLMVLDKKKKTIEHRKFSNILDYLKKGDVLVRNNTKVIPARIFGTKEKTNAHVEVILLKQEKEIWECLVGNAKVVKKGTVINFSDDLKAECVEVKDEGIRMLKFQTKGVFLEVLEKVGQMPLPPYIKEKLIDNNRYQTVYAKYNGSAAAPTAGFHFTEELLEKIKAKGVEILDVTLHIGLATFRPIKVESVENHKMHSEEIFVSKETSEKLNLAKKEKRRIIAVGTTSTRVLETVFSKYGKFKECHEESSIFIYPGYKYKAIDGIITNFHLPKSTLIMMISAFAGKDFIFSAYKEAIDKHYRFFSFGDSMFIR